MYKFSGEIEHLIFILTVHCATFVAQTWQPLLGPIHSHYMENDYFQNLHLKKGILIWDGSYSLKIFRHWTQIPTHFQWYVNSMLTPLTPINNLKLNVLLFLILTIGLTDSNPTSTWPSLHWFQSAAEQSSEWHCKVTGPRRLHLLLIVHGPSITCHQAGTSEVSSLGCLLEVYIEEKLGKNNESVRKEVYAYKGYFLSETFAHIHTGPSLFISDVLSYQL